MFQAVYDTVVMWPHYIAFVIQQEMLINDLQNKSKLNNVFKFCSQTDALFHKICSVL